MNWKNKKVLITGSEGFIGSHLTERLIALGADVRAFVLYNSFNSWGWIDTFSEKDRKNIEVFTGNICEAYNVRKAMKGVDIVFHLAALIGIPYSYYSPESYVSTNVMGTLNVLQAAREENVSKVVHTSTSETYGSALYTPMDEKHPLQGQSPYSASKIGADMLAESFFRSFKVPVATIRPFNTYGPRQSARAVIPTVIGQVLSGSKKIYLGSLTPVRDLTYVKDTVEGFIRMAENRSSSGKVVNIGSGTGTSVGALAKKILSLMKSDAGIISTPERVRPEMSEVTKLICDSSKAKKLLGWKPAYSLDEGLSETIGFISANIKRYKTGIYNV